MVNPGRRLDVHGITPEAWSRRFGVVPFEHPCSRCGALLRTTLPFVQGQLRGLRAPTCACGNERGPYAVVRDRRHGDLLDGS